MTKWKAIGVVIEGQEINIDGVNPWGLDWHKVENTPIRLPHPAYPSELHEMWVCRAESGGKTVTFAVGELSANVFGFYVPDG